MIKNKIIVIDGVDGSGKTTQINALKNIYGSKFEFAKLPWYESPTGKIIQDYLNGVYNSYEFDNIYDKVKFISDMYTMNRVEFFDNIYNPSKNYIFDRYTTSNILHMGAILQEKSLIDKYIKDLSDYEYTWFNLPEPDLVLFLDIPKELCIDNIAKRNTTHDIHETNEYIDKLYNIKDYIIEKCGWRIIRCGSNINGMYPIDKITASIISEIDSLNLKE